MPWRSESLMSQRLEFVRAVLHRAPGQSIRDVCRSTGIRHNDCWPIVKYESVMVVLHWAHTTPLAAVASMLSARSNWSAGDVFWVGSDMSNRRWTLDINQKWKGAAHSGPPLSLCDSVPLP